VRHFNFFSNQQSNYKIKKITDSYDALPWADRRELVAFGFMLTEQETDELIQALQQRTDTVFALRDIAQKRLAGKQPLPPCIKKILSLSTQ
jgi:hypothetical protein